MDNHWVNIVGALLMLTLAMALALLGKPTEMGLIIVAGAIATAFLNIDRIQRFKGAGFEAEMRQAVEQAHASVDELRNLAAISAESILTTLMAGNFMHGMTLAKRVDLHDRLINSLQGLGVPQPQINAAEEMWRRGVGILYQRGIRHQLEGRTSTHKIDPNLSKEALEASKEFQDMIKFKEWKAPSAAEMRHFIEEKHLMSPALEELLRDYSHFEKTNTIRRIDVFVEL
jgi:hypothetical protein